MVLNQTGNEVWRQNLQYILSLNRNFAGFLTDSMTWLKKSPGSLVVAFRMTPNLYLKLPVERHNKSVLILN